MLEFKLALVKGSTRPQRFAVHGQEAVIGRQKGCEVRVPSQEVSRRHCLFRVENGYVTVEDLGSANGTYLNEELIEGRQVVRPGDQIRIGPVVFVAEYHLSQEAMERLAAVEEADVEIVQQATPIEEEEFVNDVEIKVASSADNSARPALRGTNEQGAEVEKNPYGDPIPVTSDDKLTIWPPRDDEEEFTIEMDDDHATEKQAALPEIVEFIDDENEKDALKKNEKSADDQEPEKAKLPLPEPSGEGEELTEGWHMPKGGDLGALLNSIEESDQGPKKRKKKK